MIYGHRKRLRTMYPPKERAAKPLLCKLGIHRPHTFWFFIGTTRLMCIKCSRCGFVWEEAD